MNNYRIYGKSPYMVAVVHGGPGASGEMAPVAEELSSSFGVLEPLQTATSVSGQVAELQNTLQKMCEPPVTLIGYSWGAWLSYLLAARYPATVKKLILVSSGPFEEKYTHSIRETRLSRLTPVEREEFDTTGAAIGNQKNDNNSQLLKRLGELANKADTFKPFQVNPKQADSVVLDINLFRKVWPKAAQLRRSGELLSLGRNITCPTIAIHGDYDPHPAEGVQMPLSEVLKDFRFILLSRCGHTPWIEQDAHEQFFAVLRAELT